MSAPLKAVLLTLVVAGSFLAGTLYVRKSENPKANPGGRRILYYVDPMHPAYKSDKPGIAPDCGMQLEPVYSDMEQATPALDRASMPSGTVQITSDQQQSIGAKTQEVTRDSGTQTLRVLGRVTLDETRVFRVAVPVDGLVRNAGPIASGTIIGKDDVLATFYNRDFLTAQQTYLYALNTMDRFKDDESEEQLKLTGAQKQAAEENLEFLGMGKTQLAAIGRTREIAKEIEVRSPVAGLVLARNAFQGLRFDRGTELFKIADLSHIWILADIFENDAKLLQEAKSATVTYRGRLYPVQMSKSLPQFDPESRALKVRLEMDNPDFALRPEMFVDVEFSIAFPEAVTVPIDAVLDTGLHKRVFVDRGNGLFEPREVETGWRFGDKVQVRNGLRPGERIVTSGTFLVDSESRMKAKAAGSYGMSGKDPVCGMDIDESKSKATGKKSEYKGKTYYFCSDHCKELFDKDPDRYSAAQDRAQIK